MITRTTLDAVQSQALIGSALQGFQNPGGLGGQVRPGTGKGKGRNFRPFLEPYPYDGYGGCRSPVVERLQSVATGFRTVVIQYY